MSRDSLFFQRGAGYNECRLETIDLIPPDSRVECGEQPSAHRQQPHDTASTTEYVTAEPHMNADQL